MTIISLGCICGGVVEAFLVALAVSGFGAVAARWRKRRHKHSDHCKH